MTIPGLARIGNIQIDKAANAIEVLLAPDKYSTTPDNEGRRIERVEGGFRILNWAIYRELAKGEHIREQNRLAQERFRNRHSDEEADEIHHEEPEDAPTVKDGPAEVKKHSLYHDDTQTVLQFLNEASGKQFREVEANLTIISARLNEDGVDLEGVKKMILHRCSLWKNDPKMREYLRPETLFRKSKFDSYYATRNESVQNGNGSGLPNPRPNPRNEGIVIGPTDYGSAGERRMRETTAAIRARRSAAEAVAGQVAGADQNLPGIG